jgi:hypothetical protein
MPTPLPLTEEQIETLFKFVKSKYVDFYDVQVELVDHLASEVETRMAESPGVTFDAALQQVYARFGIFGFLDVVEQRESAVMRRNRKLWWTHFKGLFRPPMVAGSLLLALGIYFLFKGISLDAFVATNGVLAFLSYAVSSSYFKQELPRKDYQLSSFKYSKFVYFGAVLNLYQTYNLFLRKVIIGFESTFWMSIIVSICWLGWMIMWAGLLSFNAMIKEQRKLYPLAFA